MKHKRISLLMFFMLAVLLSITLSSAVAQEDSSTVKPVLAAAQDEVAQTASPPANLTETEFNGSPATANPIEVGDVISGKIGQDDDLDFFVLEDPYPYSFLLFDIDARVNGSELDSVICLLDQDGNEVACNDDSDGLDSLIYYNVNSSTHYVRVREFSYPYESGDSYTYTLSVTNPLLISANKNGRVEGMRFQKSDVLAWQQFTDGSEKWSMFFDASDFGIKGDLEAVGHTSTPNGISLALSKSQKLCIWDDALGYCTRQRIKPHDVLGFRPGSYGPRTWGELYIIERGANQCLSSSGEKIDALFDRGDQVNVSTTGRVKLCSGAKFSDEDIFESAGSMDFDGSQVPGLVREDIIAADYGYFLGSEWRLLTIQGSGKIFGNKVDQKKIFSIHIYEGVYSWSNIVWDGKEHNFNYPIDALEW